MNMCLQSITIKASDTVKVDVCLVCAIEHSLPNASMMNVPSDVNQQSI
jgi:hypothetical protein